MLRINRHGVSAMPVIAAALLLMVWLLAACGGQAAPAPEPTAAPPTQPPTQAPTQPPTHTAAPPTATTAPTLAPTATQPPATATTAPTQAPTAAPVASADNCVKCHTSEETLQKLAKAEEPTEKLSEGEG